MLCSIMSMYQIKHERECFILIGTSKGCRASTCKSYLVKMSRIVALADLEAMEKKTVNISKSGNQTDLSCSSTTDADTWMD